MSEELSQQRLCRMVGQHERLHGYRQTGRLRFLRLAILRVPLGQAAEHVLGELSRSRTSGNTVGERRNHLGSGTEVLGRTALVVLLVWPLRQLLQRRHLLVCHVRSLTRCSDMLGGASLRGSPKPLA